MSNALADEVVEIRPLAWIVYNRETENWKRYTNESEAVEITSTWPDQMKLIPMFRDFEIDDDFLDILAWAFGD